MDPEERLAREVLARGWISQELLGHALRHRAQLRQQGRDVPLLALLQQAAPPFAQPMAQLAVQLAQAPGQTQAAPPQPHAPPAPPYAPQAPHAPLPPGSTTRPAPPQPPGGSYPPPQGPTRAAGFAPPQTPVPAAQDTFAIMDPPGAPPAPVAGAPLPPPGGAFSPASLGKLGPYELVREIARGGVGAVFEAVQPAVNRRVAVKVLLDTCSDPEQAERFKREGQAVTRLTHENIVTVHDFGYEGKQSYLVMELVLGDTLKQRVQQRHPLPIGDAIRYTLKLARAMAYAHSKGVIHRDLKPQNVILDARDEPRITDFGLARIADLESLTKTGAVMGTPAYMAPEQVRGAKLDHRCDVYALGVILYELLTGKPPFRKKTVVAVMDQVLRQDPEPPRALRPEVPPALEALCLACMTKDPDERLGTALELAEELDDLGRGATPDASDPDAGSGSRVSWSLVLAALVALAGVGAAAWVLLAQR